MITADAALLGESHIPLKKKVDEVLDGGTSIQHVLVAKRTGEKVDMKENRDKDLEEVDTLNFKCMLCMTYPKNVSHCAVHGVAGYRLCMYMFRPHIACETYKRALW